MRCGVCKKEKPDVGYSPLYGLVCRECLEKNKRKGTSAFFGE